MLGGKSDDLLEPFLPFSWDAVPPAPDDPKPASAPEPRRLAQRLLSVLSGYVDYRAALSDIPGGCVSALVMIVVDVSAASVIFASQPAHAAQGANLCLLCGVLPPVLLQLLSRTELRAPYCADAFVASLFGAVATRLSPPGSASPFGTLVVSMAITNLLLGVSFTMLGLARIGRVVQFVPAPVLAGFLGSMGYVQLDSLCRMSTGCSATELACMARSGSVDQLCLALGLGLALHIGGLRMQRWPRLQQLLVPLMVGVCTALYAAARAFLPPAAVDRWGLHLGSGGGGGHAPGAADGGGAFEPGGGSDVGSVAQLPATLDLAHVRWGAAAQHGVATAAVALIPSIIGRLLTFSAAELVTGDLLDTSDEFVRLGIAQTASCAVGTIPMVSLPGFSVAYSLGARGRVAPLVSAFASASLAWVGAARALSAIPGVVFAGMLASIAANFLCGQLGAAWRQLTRLEFALVLTHILATALVGMAYAVGLGLLASVVIFAFDYGRVSGVLQHATAALESSRVARSRAEREALARLGPCTLIVHLQVHRPPPPPPRDRVASRSSCHPCASTARPPTPRTSCRACPPRVPTARLTASRRPPRCHAPCQGMLFFGSAATVDEVVRRHHRTLTHAAADGLRLRFVVLDCDRCPAMDSTAASVLVQCRKQCGGTPWLLAGANDAVRGRPSNPAPAGSVVP